MRRDTLKNQGGVMRGRKSSIFKNSSAVLAVCAGLAVGQEQPWNLPYIRPAAYDYTQYYSPSLNNYLSLIAPDYFKKTMDSAWSYYKANFMMSNGLINQRTYSNGTVSNTNVAVSEGQGYGMIFSVLMNDQTTFNKIFEAANTYMWSDAHKSYYIWSYPSGAQGAATDADLDIGLALVFADALQGAGLWQTYNKNGITYHSRAMDVIVSIHDNMVAQNYLLPGDSWGSDGVNNLNPSYFATAWLKVFDAYQTQVSFTSVIDNCYAVLAKMPRYSKGQAVDWCTPSGGQASQAGGKTDQGLGMLSDAIRTPYRIAMDALWFKDSRAIAYCENSKGTLTQYTNSNIILMAAQMAQYDNNGNAIASTSGDLENVAMWSAGVLGSLDTAYTRRATNSSVLAIISGNGPFLGSQSLQDQEFYYDQSLGMLGFAVLGGQFPNVLADQKTAISAVHFIQPVAQNGHSDRAGFDGSTVWLTPEGYPAVPGSASHQTLPTLRIYNLLGRAAEATAH